MPALVRLYIRNVAIGFALALVFTGLLLWLDVGGLGGLVLRSDIGAMAALMLVVFNGIVFAGVQFSIAVMRMEDRGDAGPRGNAVASPTAAAPCPVRAGDGAR